MQPGKTPLELSVTQHPRKTDLSAVSMNDEISVNLRV